MTINQKWIIIILSDEASKSDNIGKAVNMEDMTREEFKTIMEMVRMIVEGSADKQEALEKIDSLTILKDTKKTE